VAAEAEPVATALVAAHKRRWFEIFRVGSRRMGSPALTIDGTWESRILIGVGGSANNGTDIL
jgi:hypothetical protein